MKPGVWIKSSHSGYNGDCVEVAMIPPAWREASASGGGNCVQVASTAGSILVRDSKNPDGPPLEFTPAEWRAFLASLGR